MNKVRYEITLPLTLNDGSPQPPGLIEWTADEIVAAVGGCSVDGESVGFWKFDGVVYKDRNRRVLIDTDDSMSTSDFISQLKAVLKLRFQQHEIYIVRYPIEVV